MLAAGLKVAQDFKMKKKKKKVRVCVCVFVEGMGGGCSQAKPWLCVSTRDALEPRRVFVQILCIAANDYDSQICTDGCKSLRYSNVPRFFFPPSQNVPECFISSLCAGVEGGQRDETLTHFTNKVQQRIKGSSKGRVDFSVLCDQYHHHTSS